MTHLPPPPASAGMPPPPPAVPRPVAPGKTPWALIIVVSVAFLGWTALQTFFALRTVNVARATFDPPPTSGEPPICTATDHLLDSVEAAPNRTTNRPMLLDLLLPTEMGPPFEYVEDRGFANAESIGAERGPEWLAELRADGFRHALIRGWSLPDETSASVYVYEFATHEGALAFQRFALEDQSCPYSHDVFEIDRVKGSIGLQISWADGSESEQVSFVRGPRRYLANVRGPSVPPRTLVVRLTRRLSETAG